MEEGDREALKKDLSNMLACLERVQNFPAPELSDSEIYDAPRGVHDAPRGVHDAPINHPTNVKPEAPTATAGSLDENDNRSFEAEEAKRVWANMVRPKTVRRGGSHEFLAIETNSVPIK